MDTTDIDQLLEFMLAFAEHYLQKGEGLHPFGAYLAEDRSVGGISIDPDEVAGDQDVITDIQNKLREQTTFGDVLATAICGEVKLPRSWGLEMNSAILIELEDPSGAAISVQKPFRYGLFNKLILGKQSRQNAKSVIFKSAAQSRDD